MYTQCPKCSTVFRIQEDQITRHKGLVRCGTCRETFNAAWNEVHDLAAVRTRNAQPAPKPLDAQPPMSADTSTAPPDQRLPVSNDRREPAGSVTTDFRVVEADAAPANVKINWDITDRPPAGTAPQSQTRESPGEDSGLWKPLPPPTPAAPAPSRPGTISAKHAPPPLRIPEPELESGPLLPPAATLPSAEEPSAPSTYDPPRLPDKHEAHVEFGPAAFPVVGDEPDTVEEIVLESRDNFWEKADQPAVPAKTPAREPARVVAEGPARRQRGLAWTVAALVLLAIAIWQFVFFYFDTLAQSPRARPILEAVCGIFRCQVPERRQLSKIEVAGASVAYHEEMPGALRISVNLVNRASFPQAEPTLQVTLTDKDAKVVGRRAYKAAEYRRESSALAPNVVTLATLDLAAPPENAVGYEIALFD